MFIRLIILSLIYSSFTYALEVDEKLTGRIIKASDSRKTLLINRGTEDGLVEGDHAKFYVSAGVIARAVLRKISPSRSIWSIYRLVNADFIIDDSLVTLRITPPVKLTEDETKPLLKDDTPLQVGIGDPAKLNIPLAEGADDLDKNLDQLDANEMKNLQWETSQSISLALRPYELFAHLAFSNLSGKSEGTPGGYSFSNSQVANNFGAGLELYPTKEHQWFSRFSLVAKVSNIHDISSSYQGSQTESQITELSVGANYHLADKINQTDSMQPYVHLSAHMGSGKSTYTPGTEGTESFSTRLTSNGFAMGGGVKYFLTSHWSARLQAEYYLRSEKYKADVAGLEFTRNLSGPRIWAAFGYRF